METVTQKKTISRIDYIDYLRGWAVLLMIFWHSIDALLSSHFKSSNAFIIAQFVGGIVAPAFLFTAGASLTIVLSKYREDILYFKKRAVRQLIRIFQILIIAYLLHFPFKILTTYPLHLSDEQYLNFIKSDILHTIAIGLLLMQILYFMIRKENIFYIFILLSAIIIVILTPYVSRFDFLTILPIEIATYFNIQYYSLFPLFPWLAYLMIGSVIMQIILKYKEADREKKIINILFLIGIGLIVFGSIPEFFNLETTDYYSFWHTSPNIFMIKIGIVLILLYVLSLCSVKRSYKMKVFNIFGRESLFVYVVHLLIIFGTDNPFTLSYYFGNRCNWVGFWGIYFSLLIIMLILAKSYNKIKIGLRKPKI
jgi:uncharacterized membrane protein